MIPTEDRYIAVRNSHAQILKEWLPYKSTALPMDIYQKIFNIDDDIIIITGACGGLGRQIARIILEAGATAVCLDQDSHRLPALVNVLGQKKACDTMVCDVTSSDSISSVLEQVMAKYHRIDALINCAGILGQSHSIFDIEESDWDQVQQVNLKGTWLMSTAVARVMRSQKQGRIVNISSSLGLRSQPQRLHYAASKAGVEHLTRNMALEWAKEGIQVNCLAPGWMNTPMVEDILSGPQGSHWRHTIPLSRAADPEELAGALLLLCSSASSYMTGSILRVDGGYCLNGIASP